MLKFIRALFCLLVDPYESEDANEWARLEFGRDAIKSDFEGKIL